MFGKKRSKDHYSTSGIEYVVPSPSYGELHIPGDDDDSSAKYPSYNDAHLKEHEDKGPSVDSEGYLYNEIHDWSNRWVILSPWVLGLAAFFATSVWIYLQFRDDLVGQYERWLVYICLAVIMILLLFTWRANFKHQHDYISVEPGKLILRYADNAWLGLIGTPDMWLTRNISKIKVKPTVFQKYVTKTCNIIITLSTDEKPIVLKRVKDGNRLFKALGDSIPS